MLGYTHGMLLLQKSWKNICTLKCLNGVNLSIQCLVLKNFLLLFFFFQFCFLPQNQTASEKQLLKYELSLKSYQSAHAVRVLHDSLVLQEFLFKWQNKVRDELSKSHVQWGAVFIGKSYLVTFSFFLNEVYSFLFYLKACGSSLI